MAKKGIFEFVNLQRKTHTLKDGRDYEMVVAVSDNSNEIAPGSEVGKKLMMLGFMQHPEGYYYKFKKHLTGDDLQAIQTLNADLQNQGATPENLDEYIKLSKEKDTRKDGSEYEYWHATSDVPGEVTKTSPVGRWLQQRRFIWHAKQRMQKSADQFTQDDLDAIQKYNEFLETQGSQDNPLQDVIDELENLRDSISGSDLPIQSQEDLELKIGTFISKLADATEEEAEKLFQHFVTVADKFYSYSEQNQLLIFLQKPDATRIASASDWNQDFGRRVVKRDEVITINCANNFYLDTTMNPPKEKEYKIRQQRADSKWLRDVTSGAVQDDANKRQLIDMRKILSREPVFAPCPVFDISATEGRPLAPTPERVTWTSEVNTNNDNSAIANAVFEVAKKSLISNGIQVTQNPATAGEAGWSRRGQINVSPDVTGTYAVSTIIKEWAGDLLHHEGGEFYDTTLDYFEQKGELDPAQIQQIEKVREAAVSAAICNHLGLPTDEHPRYMAQLKTQGGLNSAQLIRENLSTLTKVSNYILLELRRHENQLNSVAGIQPQRRPVQQ